MASQDKLIFIGTLLTVTPSVLKPMVTAAVAVFPLLLALLDTTYHALSYIVTSQLEAVQAADDPVYEKVPFSTACHAVAPPLV